MNVVSNKTIKDFVRRCSGVAIRHEVKAWLGAVVPKVVRKTDSLMRKVVTTQDILDEWPSRDDRAIADKLVDQMHAGVPLVKVANKAGLDRLFEDVRRTIDWLDAIPEWDRHLKRLNRMSFEDASRLSVEWHAMLKRLALTGDLGDGTEETALVEAFPSGYRLVELLDAAALTREGALMGHCVGGLGYVQSVRQGRCRILSLRDDRNMPHATIEIRQRAALQIKGKGNVAPIPAYAGMVRDYVLKEQLRVGHDGSRIGLITVMNRTVGHPDDAIEALMDIDMSKRSSGAPYSLARHVPELVLAYLGQHQAQISIEARRRLVGHVAGGTGPSGVRSTSKAVVACPSGISMMVHEHIVPRDLVDLLDSGLVRGAEAEVAERLGPIVDEALDRMEREPTGIHSVGLSGSRMRFEVVVAFAGRQDRLLTVMAAVKAARAGKRDEIQAAIRKATSHDPRRGVPSQSWAHAKAEVARVSDAAIESRRAADKTACVI